MTILLSLFGQAAIAPDKEKNFLMPEQPETASEGAIHEIVSQNESKASLPCKETRQNAPCEANRTKDESKAMMPLRSKNEASETPQPGPPDDVGTDTQDDAVACPQYPSDCLACPEYRGMMRWWCRKFHWWKPWTMPGTGELPAVTIHRGHVRHVYQDGTTRLVGIAAAPTVPASVMPPVPNQAAAPMTRAERWHEAAKGGLC